MTTAPECNRCHVAINRVPSMGSRVPKDRPARVTLLLIAHDTGAIGRSRKLLDLCPGCLDGLSEWYYAAAKSEKASPPAKSTEILKGK